MTARASSVPAGTSQSGATSAPVAAASDPVFLGAGDVASCSSSGDTATARLAAAIPGTVFTAGDNAYDRGSAGQFANCYDPTWGRVKSRTRPTPGNHDYGTTNASGYFGYFGSRAGTNGRGYYAYSLGQWRIYALNSNCSFVSCSSTSAQVRWLKSDLAANPRKCVLAYWHHPLFSSGRHGNDAAVKPFWNVLYAAHADVVVNGHDHDYERFARQSPSGVRTARGVREFVVGTGGASHRVWGTFKRNSLARNNTTYGVLKLALHATSYSWRFVPVAGKTYTDSGTTTCG